MFNGSTAIHSPAPIKDEARVWDRRPVDHVIASPPVSTEDARARFGEVEEVKPYLRWTAQPSA